MNEDDARAFAAAWADVWNRRNLDAILAHYADDVVLTSPLAARWKRWKNARRFRWAISRVAAIPLSCRSKAAP